MISSARFGSLKATTATTAETISFLPDEIACGGVSEYVLNSVTVQYQHITRFRVKLNGVTISNFTPAVLSAIWRRFSKWDNPAATAVVGTIPLHAMTFADDPQLRAMCLPAGQATVEVDKNATPGAGTIGIAWRRQDDPARMVKAYTSIFSEQGNVAASSVAELPIRKPGLLRGLVLPECAPAYLDDVQLLFRGYPIINNSGANLLALESMEGGVVQTTAYVYVPLRDPVPASECVLRLTTGASWTGAANEIGYVTITPW